MLGQDRPLMLIFFALLLSLPLRAADPQVLFREDFNDLDDWNPLFFAEIPQHTTYTIESEGTQRYLKADSWASASALIYKQEFNVYDYPYIRWHWKVDNIYRGADVSRKEGDDYPIRVYIIFKYDPAQAGSLERITYAAARLRYGEYPPHSALNYVWSSNTAPQTIITNPYSKRSKMILLQKGSERTGQWVEESLNILEDYQRAFGKKPPGTASLAVMNDSDNTGESAVSYIDFIELSRSGN